MNNQLPQFPSGSLEKIDKRKLFIVFNRAMSKARKTSNDPKLIQRLKKALGILQHHDYYVAERSLYHPTATHCNCKDLEYWYAKKRAYKFHCKHMIAEILLERISQVKYQQLKLL